MNSFSLMVLLICGFSHSEAPVPNDFNIQQCSIEVEAKVDGKDLTLKAADGAIEPIRYFIADDQRKLISEEKNSKNLKRGTYTYYVIDKNGCSNKGEIEIK